MQLKSKGQLLLRRRAERVFSKRHLAFSDGLDLLGNSNHERAEFKINVGLIPEAWHGLLPIRPSRGGVLAGTATEANEKDGVIIDLFAKRVYRR
jgi:hypothetical protein